MFILSIALPRHQRLQFKAKVVNTLGKLTIFPGLSQTLNNLLECCKCCENKTSEAAISNSMFCSSTPEYKQSTTGYCTALLQIWYHFRVTDAVLTEFICVQKKISLLQFIHFRGTKQLFPSSRIDYCCPLQRLENLDREEGRKRKNIFHQTGNFKLLKKL